MRKRTLIAMLLALLIPGAGHFYLGERRKAYAFFAIITLLFVIGLAVDGRLYANQTDELLMRLATLGSMGSGALYLLGRLTGPYGDITSLTFEYGTAFTLTAGLMNLLLVLDAFDLAEGRKEEKP
jgi:hypothetical protein